MNFPSSLDVAAKAAPWLIAGALALSLAWVRGDKIKAEAKRDEAVASVTQLAAANADSAKAIRELKASQDLANETTKQLNQRLDVIDGQGERINQRLRETLAHDPASRDWGSVPVPKRVRNDLRSEEASADVVPH